jgi:CCR4-NOT transcription complex subunit 3
MERFKACEKEMKTKAFSKEGLLASSKMDPKEKERHEMGHFLMEMVEELGKQVEQLEAEQESLQIALKKGRKDPGKVERLSEVEHLVERHKWHQGRLELILRLLENGNLQTEQVFSAYHCG